MEQTSCNPGSLPPLQTGQAGDPAGGSPRGGENSRRVGSANLALPIDLTCRHTHILCTHQGPLCTVGTSRSLPRGCMGEHPGEHCVTDKCSPQAVGSTDPLGHVPPRGFTVRLCREVESAGPHRTGSSPCTLDPPAGGPDPHTSPAVTASRLPLPPGSCSLSSPRATLARRPQRSSAPHARGRESWLLSHCSAPRAPAGQRSRAGPVCRSTW